MQGVGVPVREGGQGPVSTKVKPPSGPQLPGPIGCLQTPPHQNNRTSGCEFASSVMATVPASEPQEAPNEGTSRCGWEEKEASWARRRRCASESVTTRCTFLLRVSSCERHFSTASESQARSKVGSMASLAKVPLAASRRSAEPPLPPAARKKAASPRKPPAATLTAASPTQRMWCKPWGAQRPCTTRAGAGWPAVQTGTASPGSRRRKRPRP
mmetsp:Transcript_21731/g.60696  ORF Transcript_21731/g.60696 Transcript_21731/m.60696 type:complete len:213 (+) Transcript_21731:146-784(+)